MGGGSPLMAIYDDIILKVAREAEGELEDKLGSDVTGRVLFLPHETNVAG